MNSGRQVERGRARGGFWSTVTAIRQPRRVVQAVQGYVQSVYRRRHRAEQSRRRARDSGVQLRDGVRE